MKGGWAGQGQDRFMFLRSPLQLLKGKRIRAGVEAGQQAGRRIWGYGRGWQTEYKEVGGLRKYDEES